MGLLGVVVVLVVGVVGVLSRYPVLQCDGSGGGSGGNPWPTPLLIPGTQPTVAGTPNTWVFTL